MIHAPAAPTARPTDARDCAVPARTCRGLAVDVGRDGLALRRGFQGFAEPPRTHRRRTADAGRVHLPLPLGRHEVVLVELTPVADEPPPRRDERRLPGREAA
ncbi:hypothetical protein ACIGPN_12510 [Streptomyces afghaniensis]|uniref:hypothetical protein n=1 Tax=Streptomyces TaxID=1883 RepID=UPI001FAF0F62|nr:hypothetical protein [Streptomyces sp. HP-A2021]UOB09630.1 hypothetical protein MQE23_11410 [Streptomyces sp. HP-A2021]